MEISSVDMTPLCKGVILALTGNPALLLLLTFHIDCVIFRMRVITVMSRMLFFLLLMNACLSFATSAHAHRTVHIFVALCDNEHQGIVPVAPEFGNGDDPENNLYWGAYYGVRSYFLRSKEWKMVSETEDLCASVLERCVFQHTTEEVYVVADAYRGKEIRTAIVDFLNAASGNRAEQESLVLDGDTLRLSLSGNADLLAYIGHDGLMDFDVAPHPAHADSVIRDVLVIACISRNYFREALQEAGAHPLVWTTGLLAAEAYPLKAAIDGWILNESPEQIRMRAAEAYHRYQKCGLNAARNLFVTGF